MSRVLAGPLCGQLLADLGADVIKIERPVDGRRQPRLGTRRSSRTPGEPTRESAFYLSCNRGKRSVTVDLGTPAGWRAHPQARRIV